MKDDELILILYRFLNILIYLNEKGDNESSHDRALYKQIQRMLADIWEENLEKKVMKND